MTTVTILRENQTPVGFRSEGHSGYGEQGTDIVCASISSAVMLTVNGILEVAKGNGAFDIQEEGAVIHFLLDSRFWHDAACLAFIKAFAIHAKALKEEFEPYLNVQYEEVQRHD